MAVLILATEFIVPSTDRMIPSEAVHFHLGHGHSVAVVVRGRP